MKKTIILLTIITLIILSACKKEIQEPIQPCIKITYLDPEMRLDVGQIPKGTWAEKACFSGKKVEYSDLITTEDNSEWIKALYCEDENYFWIADFDSIRMTEKLRWYGVWEGRPCGLSE